MERLICVAIGYAFGLIQSGYLYGRINHIDIRQHGSGNAGSTNVLRVMGTKAGAVVFLGDFFKAVAAICLVRVLFASGSDSVDLLALYAGLYMGGESGQKWVLFVELFHGHVLSLYFLYHSTLGLERQIGKMFRLRI